MTTTFEETLPPKRWSWWPRVVLHASWPWQKDQKDNPEPAPSYIENKHNGHKFPHLHEQLLRAKFSEGFIALLPYPWSVKVSLSQSTFTLIMWKSLQKRVHGYMEIWITEIDEAWCRWSWHGSWYWFTIVLIFVNAHLTKRPTKRSGAAWRLTPQRPVRSWAREHPQDPCGPADGKAHCWHWYLAACTDFGTPCLARISTAGSLSCPPVSRGMEITMFSMATCSLTRPDTSQPDHRSFALLPGEGWKLRGLSRKACKLRRSCILRVFVSRPKVKKTFQNLCGKFILQGFACFQTSECSSNGENAIQKVVESWTMSHVFTTSSKSLLSIHMSRSMCGFLGLPLLFRFMPNNRATSWNASRRLSTIAHKQKQRSCGPSQQPQGLWVRSSGSFSVEVVFNGFRTCAD